GTRAASISATSEACGPSRHSMCQPASAPRHQVRSRHDSMISVSLASASITRPSASNRRPSDTAASPPPGSEGAEGAEGGWAPGGRPAGLGRRAPDRRRLFAPEPTASHSDRARSFPQPPRPHVREVPGRALEGPGGRARRTRNPLAASTTRCDNHQRDQPPSRRFEEADVPRRVAIVGSGPAGIYTAEALRKQAGEPVEVDILERLPTPYGLVRYGVAPDHTSIKSIAGYLRRVLESPGVRFL